MTVSDCLVCRRRSQVQSSPFRVTFLSLTLLVSHYVLGETAIIYILKLSIRYVLLIQNYVKLTLDSFSLQSS